MHRVQANHDPYAAPVPIPNATELEYATGPHDVGSFLMFEFVPVRSDGEEGGAVTATTGLISEGVPQACVCVCVYVCVCMWMCMHVYVYVSCVFINVCKCVNV